MNAAEVLRIVEALHKDKDIDKEIIFRGIEEALMSASRKKFGMVPVEVEINRETGLITAKAGERDIDPNELGRIAALTAKQIMIQKIREAERDVIFEEYDAKRGQLVTGTVQRFEGPNIVINLGKTEGFLPKREQVPGETYRLGERIKLIVLDVERKGQKVKIFLSRNHPMLVRTLFQMEVPEIASNIVEIKELAREGGYRTKVAVASNDARVDAVGACVGVRGSRIKNVVDELNGEKIDIVRWHEAPEVLIMNAMKPAEISQLYLDYEDNRAIILVDEDQQSLAIGRKGQNVRLASRLTGWNIDVITVNDEKYHQYFGRGQSTVAGILTGSGTGDGEVTRTPSSDPLGVLSRVGQRPVTAAGTAGEPATDAAPEGSNGQAATGAEPVVADEQGAAAEPVAAAGTEPVAAAGTEPVAAAGTEPVAAAGTEPAAQADTDTADSADGSVPEPASAETSPPTEEEEVPEKLIEE